LVPRDSLSGRLGRPPIHLPKESSLFQRGPPPLDHGERRRLAASIFHVLVLCRKRAHLINNYYVGDVYQKQTALFLASFRVSSFDFDLEGRQRRERFMIALIPF
jgi:hypothetical protein